jgi:hypothetical protein
MKKNFAAYIPEYVVSENQKEKTLTVTALAKLSESDRRQVIIHGKTIDPNRPLYNRVVASAHSIAHKYGPFTGKMFKTLAERTTSKGNFVFPLLKDLLGGSQGATAWGTMHVTTTDEYTALLDSLGIKTEFLALSKEKQLARLSKLVGKCEKFAHLPEVKLISDGLVAEGLIPCARAWMEENGLVFGEKAAGVCKGLFVPADEIVNAAETDIERQILAETFTGADIYLPACENKLKLAPEKLAGLMGYNRDLCPEKALSTNLATPDGSIGRRPKMSHSLQALLRKNIKVELTDIKAFVEHGTYTDELIDHLFGFTDKKGVRKLRKEGELIKSGTSPVDPLIRREVQKAVNTLVSRRLQPKTDGVYGVLYPLEYVPASVERCQGWGGRWPWEFPVLHEYAIYQHMICVPMAVIKLFGGDCDRDPWYILDDRSNSGMKWSDMADRLTDWMKMPKKAESPAQDKTMEETIAVILDQYAGCGQVYQNGKITVDAAAKAGWSYWRCLELEARIYATHVQPYINGFKSQGFEGKLPSVKDMADEFGVPVTVLGKDDKDRPITNLDHATMYYKAVRGAKGGVWAMNAVARKLDASASSLSYYERCCARFKSWTPLTAEQAALDALFAESEDVKVS